MTERAKFDLDAAIATASRGPYVFQFKGRLTRRREWTMAPVGDLDMSVVEAADSGEIEAVRELLRAAMGDKQYETFVEAGGTGIDAVTHLFPQYLEHNGYAVGESAASSRSSASTARQRKPKRDVKAGR